VKTGIQKKFCLDSCFRRNDGTGMTEIAWQKNVHYSLNKKSHLGSEVAGKIELAVCLFDEEKRSITAGAGLDVIDGFDACSGFDSFIVHVGIGNQRWV